MKDSHNCSISDIHIQQTANIQDSANIQEIARNLVTANIQLSSRQTTAPTARLRVIRPYSAERLSRLRRRETKAGQRARAERWRAYLERRKNYHIQGLGQLNGFLSDKLTFDVEYRKLYARFLAWNRYDMPEPLRRSLPVEVVADLEKERSGYFGKLTQ
jgi:hypothetical protein